MRAKHTEQSNKKNLGDVKTLSKQTHKNTRATVSKPETNLGREANRQGTVSLIKHSNLGILKSYQETREKTN